MLVSDDGSLPLTLGDLQSLVRSHRVLVAREVDEVRVSHRRVTLGANET